MAGEGKRRLGEGNRRQGLVLASHGGGRWGRRTLSTRGSGSGARQDTRDRVERLKSEATGKLEGGASGLLPGKRRLWGGHFSQTPCSWLPTRALALGPVSCKSLRPFLSSLEGGQMEHSLRLSTFFIAHLSPFTAQGPACRRPSQ